MKEKSLACLLWVALFLIMAIGCGLCSYKNHVLAFYAIGFVCLARIMWWSDGKE